MKDFLNFVPYALMASEGDAGDAGGGELPEATIEVKDDEGKVHVVTFRETDAEIEVVPPDGITQEEWEKLQAKVAEKQEQALEVLASKRKPAETPKTEPEKKETAKKEEEQPPKEEPIPPNLNPVETDTLTEAELMRCWGVKTQEELNDLRDDFPKKYAKGLALLTSDITAGLTQEARMKQQIESDGNSYEAVMAFARANGHTNIAAAYDHFKLRGRPAAAKSLEEVRKKQVSFAAAGTGKQSPINAKPIQIAEDLFNRSSG
jgi:hypothetical protein